MPPARGIPNYDTGALWAGELNAGLDWGTWIRLIAACRMAVQVSWGGTAVPIIHVLDEAGTPRVASTEAAGNSVPTWIELPMGTTYVAVQQLVGPIQDVRVAIWLPPAAAAAQWKSAS